MIIIDPNRRIGFTLRRFAGNPEPERPTFYTRPLTASQFSQVQKALADHDAATTLSDKLRALATGLKVGLVGWERVQRQDGAAAVFGQDDPADLVSYLDMVDLVVGMADASDLAMEDRKKSRSLSASGTERSVASAPAAEPAAGKGAGV